MMPSFSPQDLIGCLVDGRYRLETLAGQGGFGSVYRAHHVRFCGSVAVKILRIPSYLDAEARKCLVASFEGEGRLLFELSALHPAIVQVKESGVLFFQGLSFPYLVMEWLDGLTLETDIRNRQSEGYGPRDLEEAIQILNPIAEALALVHSQGIAHRDIKPGNVFLSRVGTALTPKLLDFGIAKVLSPAGTQSAMYAPTSDGRGAFTELYGAPEQWFCRLGATGPWTDVYAFALLLVEMLSGKRPHLVQTTKQLAGAAIDPEIRPTPRAAGVDVPDAVETVFQRALAVDPRERPRSVGEFWHELLEASRFVPSAFATPLPYDTTVLLPAKPQDPISVHPAENGIMTGVTESASHPPTSRTPPLGLHPPVSGDFNPKIIGPHPPSRRQIVGKWLSPIAVSVVLALLTLLGLSRSSTPRPQAASQPTFSEKPSPNPLTTQIMAAPIPSASISRSTMIQPAAMPAPTFDQPQNARPPVRRSPIMPAKPAHSNASPSIAAPTNDSSEPATLSVHDVLQSWR
ncbi:MAG TPA: protein kinase [Polyangiaceae bacterium]|jgi:serine/threonine-protein kinase|nr:MAG: Serine/threonine-protein kinase StkP [Deltaproteobacteria bacterium ADurb.Bin207]HNZ24330.1 protein kinase [Polyangiaceae bacterium]HOD25115.1 protein kinase [Polyangiaceae bacterium]HOE49637.1 protein kinase [Polyangiaceae bacterium]HOH02390.1 protein kinase [Polyangiaceae bacterium]